ncbi:MAG: D-alanine--D-alanine ligase [Anaerolineaceae bacterium]|nr:D-alanine--D-alanine ligase [Anaerolineaceae bacterium]
MSANRKTVVGVIFGGRSVEHDVSIVTGHQVMRAFDPEHYEVVPVYIDRQGMWYTGDPLLDLKNFKNEIISLKGIKTAVISPGVRHHGLIVNPTAGRFEKAETKRLDVVFPALHGSHGEDGTIQGLCELADIAYVGCGVMASAIANDKIMTKIVLSQQGVPIVEGVSFTRNEWLESSDKVISHLIHELHYPMFVKPATLGSSIGIGKANDETLLRAHIEVAISLDRRVLVEQAVENPTEINCALLGSDSDIQASVLEQPISLDQFLTFEEKYTRGGEGMKSAERIIPAPISEDLTAKIKGIAIQAFRAIEGRGTARIDFLVKPDTGDVYLNEINTMPGSVAFYLWQEQGMSPREFVHKLVEIARDAQAEKRKNNYDYQTNLVNLVDSRGLKGVKGSKGSTTRSG